MRFGIDPKILKSIEIPSDEKFMFWDRSQIAIVSAFDKEYILYCVNLAFGHDPKNIICRSS